MAKLYNTDYPLNIQEEFKNITTFIKRDKKPLSTSSIQTYLQRIDTLYTLILKHKYNGYIDLLIDYETVIHAIQHSSYINQKNYYTPILKLFKHLYITPKYNFLKDIVDNHYFPEFIKQQAITEKKLNDNKVNDAQKHRYLTLQQIHSLYDSYTYIDNDTLITQRLLYKLIVAFYFYNPNWVPRNDLVHIVIADKKTNISPDTNYLILNARNIPSHIILNVYKTFPTYGQRIIKLSDTVKQLLIVYIRHLNKNYNDVLFTTLNNTVYAKPSFSGLVSDAFKNVLRVDMNIDIARHIHVSHFNSTLPSNNQRTQYSYVLLHSLDVASQYIKLNINEKEKEKEKEKI